MQGISKDTGRALQRIAADFNRPGLGPDGSVRHSGRPGSGHSPGQLKFEFLKITIDWPMTTSTTKEKNRKNNVKVPPSSSYETALNYYPIVRTAYIEDAHNRLVILSQQTGGTTSRKPGQLEIMLHRRSLQDDSKGACQVFNDTSGQYASIPLDNSSGTTCSQYAWAGTCRADNCPNYDDYYNVPAN